MLHLYTHRYMQAVFFFIVAGCCACRQVHPSTFIHKEHTFVFAEQVRIWSFIFYGYLRIKAFSSVSARLLFCPIFQCASAALLFFTSAYLRFRFQWLRIRNFVYDELACARLFICSFVFNNFACDLSPSVRVHLSILL
jgi:hypothetical protein